jgi:DNA-binding CsgD family transcriptional regulator
MPLKRLLDTPSPKAGLWLALLIGFQIVCALFFLGDVMVDVAEGAGTLWHLGPEFGAALGLLLGIVVETVVLLALLRRQAHMARSLGVAAGALAEVMQGHFRRWGLTPSEQDVAAFTIKGFSIAEIATLRGSAEGTVKTHLNAIYRKSGVQGRGQLVSLLIEDLLEGPLPAASRQADRQEIADRPPQGAGAGRDGG